MISHLTVNGYVAWDFHWDVSDRHEKKSKMAIFGWIFAKMADFFRDRWLWDRQFVLLPLCAQYGTFIEKS